MTGTLPLWTAADLPGAVPRLARHAGLPTEDRPGGTNTVDAAAASASLEVEPVDVAYEDTRSFVRRAGPALVQVEGGYVALIGPRGRSRVQVLSPAGRVQAVPSDHLVRAMRERMDEPFRAETDQILDEAQLSGGRRETVRERLLEQRLAGRLLPGSLLIRPAPHASLATHLRAGGVFEPLAVLLVAHLIHTALVVLAWWMIGSGALSGHLDSGWVLGWALVLATSVPFAMAATWSEGLVALRSGAVIKERLLSGALQLPSELIRASGVGGLLGRVLEAEALETLVLRGGFGALLASIDLLFAAWVLSHGVVPWLFEALLLGWIAAIVFMGLALARRMTGWTAHRRRLTHDLVERMQGHRTRLVQSAPERRYDGEDELLADYLDASSGMDALQVAAGVLGREGWVLVAVGTLVLLFATGQGTPTTIGISLGGVLLARQGLAGASQALGSLVGTWVAAREVAPLLEAAAVPPQPQGALPPPTPEGGERTAPVVSAHKVRFAYPGRSRPVLDGVNLELEHGDRVLLHGPSGGGKSTLASLLVGLRRPDDGVLLLDGLDRATLGDVGWRERTTSAPQFHENRILLGPLALNLLMGRRWPADDASLEEAEEVCRLLGLGPLLERMPAGLLQIVGESGWRLSHGEQSRVFLARTLLQDRDLVVLDESFAALDPQNLDRCLRVALERVRTLVVIAHP